MNDLATRSGYTGLTSKENRFNLGIGRTSAIRAQEESSAHKKRGNVN